MDEQQIKSGEVSRLFAKPCEFIKSASDVEHLPPPIQSEIAFVGRSNVGKSSLVNAVTGRSTLAKTSSKPGHTRQLNFFLLANQLMIVDLPGYGYAKASKKEVEGWTGLIFRYLRGRPNLRRVFLLIDSRHGLKENDIEVMSLLDDIALSYQIVLTKTDKTSKAELDALVRKIAAEAENHPAMHPELLPTSSKDNIGILSLRQAMAVVV
ncbi:MAG: YihA family ribosome biogenesis GTP-binding protein [Proteobacteria bacterium]|nr:YihA family ribosome biogenesis GTP-binding protein [Pseudomonadota bacterium]